MINKTNLTVTTFSATTSSQVALPVNSRREYLKIQNTSANIIYVNYGADATTESEKIASGESIELDKSVPTDSINIIASANSDIVIIEGGAKDNSVALELSKEQHVNIIERDFLSGMVDFSRASTATYVDADGNLKTALENEPRFDYSGSQSGLLIEGASTQKVRYATAYTDSGAVNPLSETWGRNGVTASIVSDNKFPFGDVLLVTEVEDTGSHVLTSPVGDSPSSTETWAFSLFAKAGTTDIIALSPKVGFHTSDDTHARFNLTTGTIEEVKSGLLGATIKDEGDGWYRLTIIDSVSNSTAFRTVGIQTCNPSTGATDSFLGTGRTFYACCPQIEGGNATFSTSFIPNATPSQVTRAADILSIDLTQAPWFNTDEGTLYTDAKYIADVENQTSGYRVFELGNEGSQANRIGLGILTTGALGAFASIANSVDVALNVAAEPIKDQQ